MVDILGTLVKLSAPAAVIAGTIVANDFQSDLAARSTLNQREQSESALRAQMFGNLIDPVARTNDVDEIVPEREVLLVQLLALNFHEHIELKPLMQHADWRIRQEIKRSKNASSARDDKETLSTSEWEKLRKSLLSTAKRVKDRQVAMLGVGEKQKKCAGGGVGGKTEQTFTLERQKGSSFHVLHMDRSAVAAYESASSVQAINPRFPLKIKSPDCRDSLYVSFKEMGWLERTVELQLSHEEESVREGGSEPIINEKDYDFTVSPYDFPFTDNSLLPSGNRFAVYYADSTETLKESGDSELQQIRIRFLWFPKNYFPPRERPMDYQAFRNLTGLPGAR